MPREVALALCAQQTISGWGFDVELLAIARRHGFTIREMPIPWYYMANSRVGFCAIPSTCSATC